MSIAPSTLPRRPHDPGADRAQRPPVILGFDPGLRRTGYGALRLDRAAPRVVEAGVMTTRAADSLGRRLRVLHDEVASLLRELRPRVVVLEDLFAHRRFPRTAIVLGHVRGVICLAAASAGIDVVALAPSAVKQAVAGSGRASKAQVQAAVRVLLALRGGLDTHAADALALAYTGMARATSARVVATRR